MTLPIPPSFLGDRIREAEERSDRIYDAVVGVVTDNKDPDKLGRVKVKFPTLPGDDASAWAPLVAPGAGKDRGWFFLPEIDDEVLVMFEHGNVRRPLIVGAMWNGKDKPPETNGGGNEKRTIVSREGSRIEFDDDAGTVTIEDGGGKGKVVLSQDGKVTLEASSGDVGLQAPAGDFNVVAQSIELKATQSLKIQSGQALKIGSDANSTVKASIISVSGSTAGLNGGGGASAAEASASAEEVPDPIGG